jgi:hypothetical protein
MDANLTAVKEGAEGAIYSAPTAHDENYTFVLADSGTTVYASASNASTRAWTIPPNASVAFENGTLIRLLNLSTNAVTVTRGSGVTLYWMDGTDVAVSSANRTLERRGEALLQKLSTDTWLISGNAGLF